MAPAISCPSAPMFQNFARKATSDGEAGEEQRRRLHQRVLDVVAGPKVEKSSSL